jgi:CRP/FNR family cyclic AMP-dependent transcriptional regulator
LSATARFVRRHHSWLNPRVASAPVETLQRVPLFADLDRRDLERIAASMKERRFHAGDTVTAEGGAGVGFFVIDEGEAEVKVHGEERGQLGPGDYFGEIALLTNSTRTATIVAKSDLRCYGMTPWDFKPLVEENSHIAWKLLQTMANRLNH